MTFEILTQKADILELAFSGSTSSSPFSSSRQSHERCWSPALVVPLFGSWYRQTLVHVTVEQPEHVPSGQET
ncbi:hypothetical protein EYF80_038695 [Liparis tanakae]|uniref:Uncharacterized protein n=1 Tax=Liparis tanakae TaxID=230148 RepID=A0A4Z2GC31_9TELE|nr:hypothetical protein EYF80_038695 [Liparis tanakae]